jgi:mono/diheme cytochrome c family protein
MSFAKLTFLLLSTSLFTSLACDDKDVIVTSENPDSSGETGDGDGSEVDLVARGQYLVDHVAACPDCHTPRNEMGAPIVEQYLAGADCFVRLPNGDCLGSRNLTNHETGLANRTDAEIKRMIQDGVRPAATGDEALFPVMPYYVFHNMTDQDLDAVVAYLRTVPGVDHAIQRRAAVFDLPAPAAPLDLAAVPQPLPDYAEPEAAARGRYLATQAGVCLECHTKHLMGDPKVVDYANFFAGGEEFAVGLPVTPVSKNLTSDPETGLGKWTVEDIVKVLQQGIDKHGDGVCPPMPAGPLGAFGGLTSEDTLDVAHYIKSLPPIVNLIEDKCTFPPM